MARVYKPVAVDPLTGERVKNKYWYIEYQDPEGRTRTVKGLRGRAATLLQAVELERRVGRVKGGIAQPSEPQRRRSLREHIEDFRRALVADRRAARRVSSTLEKLRIVLEGCGFYGPTEIDAARVTVWLRAQRGSGGWTAAVSRAHLEAVKSFTTWLLGDGRAATDPLADL